jgi:hypothetical protein
VSEIKSDIDSMRTALGDASIALAHVIRPLFDIKTRRMEHARLAGDSIADVTLPAGLWSALERLRNTRIQIDGIRCNPDLLAQIIELVEWDAPDQDAATTDIDTNTDGPSTSHTETPEAA